ncbi:MAG: AEC family transporter [Leptospiraceae bacterium]|nr:AEC family transporter [Leptospiraceae bacterium]
MENFSILIISFFLGIIIRKSGQIKGEVIQVINGYILNISLPSLILLYIPKLNLKPDILIPVSMAWIVFIISFIFFHLLAGVFNIPRLTMYCLILCCGLGNTSFLGLPMIEIFYGKEGIPIGILCDSPGSFLVLSVLGLPMILRANNENTTLKGTIKKIFSFPPFLAFIFSFFLIKTNYPFWLDSTLKTFGATLVPLALFSVGYGFNIHSILKTYKYIIVGLFFKMILIPIIIIFYLKFLNIQNSLLFSVIVFESAMPPMITAGIIAMEKGIDKELASNLIPVGIILSFPTLFIWNRILSSF